MREYVCRHLESSWVVEAVADGAEALARARANPPDLVLTDVMMPGLDGFALLRELRKDERTKHIPVVMLSARSGEEAKVEGLRAGADDYLTKPFAARELVARVRTQLEHARVRRALEGERDHFWRLVTQVQAGIAQTALSVESEARFRDMADSAPVMVWVSEPDGTCTYLSRSWYNFTGQTPETGLGLGWLDALHPDDAEQTREQFNAASHRRAPFALEYRLRRQDGEYRWAMDSASPRLDDGGEFLGFVGSVVDITDRKRAELALQHSEARVHELLASEQSARKEAEALYRVAESFSDAKLDLETVVQRLTDHGTELVGAQFGSFFYNVVDDAGESYMLYTLSGAPKEAFATFGLPRNTPIFQATFGGERVVRMEDVKKDPAYGQVAPHYGMPKGHLPVTSYLAVPVYSQTGTVLGGLFFGHAEPGRFTAQHERMIVAIAQSAAIAIDNARLYQEARASELRFRTIFETAPVSMWEEDLSALKAFVDDLKRIHGADLRSFLAAHPAVVTEAVDKVRILDVNPATLRMLRGTDKHQLLQSLHRVFLPETYSIFAEEMVAIAEGSRMLFADTALGTLDGQRIDVALGIAFPASTESYTRVLVTLTDISPAKLAAREREARLAEMERAVRFSDMFVGIVGHDLRNPLSAITTAAALLQTRAESERIARPVSRIAASADRMERMISQLLDLTRIRLGRGLPLERTRVDLVQLTRSIVEELAPVHQRDIRVETTGDATGSWDGDRLSQLLSNLVGNACQHSAPGTTVGLELDGSDASSVRLEVRNQGTIPAALLPVIFEPLRSGEQRHSRDGSRGLGLGLYITQQIALAHGGSIRVTSTETSGTRFTVRLPRDGAGPATQLAAGETPTA